MKSRVILPFLALAGLVLILGLACATPAAVTPTTIPTPVRPTTMPTTIPTSIPPTPTIEPTKLPEFFTDNFTGNLSNWSQFIIAGDENKLTTSTGQDGISLQLDDTQLAVYYDYTPYDYNDVELDLVFENRGRNSNNVNLICRFSKAGWYEFTVQNDGLYQIWALDLAGQTGYNLLYSGGSTAIHLGQGTNEISASCIGDELSLYINGVETRTITDTKYLFGEGAVGFGLSVSVINPVTPVIVDFKSITISQP